MGLRVITRNKRYVANVYDALIAAKGPASSLDASKRLITTIAPAAATTSTSQHSSSWQMTCWAAASAALLGLTTTVALAEKSEPAPPHHANQVGNKIQLPLNALDLCHLLFQRIHPYSFHPCSLRVSIYYLSTNVVAISSNTKRESANSAPLKKCLNISPPKVISAKDSQ